MNDDSTPPEQFIEELPGNQTTNQQESVYLMASNSPLKSALKSNSSYKIREFEWFEVETKIRLFVQKLMDPTLKQIYEDRKLIDSVQWTIKQNNENVDMLKDVVLNQGVGIPIFEEFQRKISETDLKLEQDRRKIYQYQTQIDSQIERMTFENRQLSEQCRQAELSKLLLMDEFNQTKQTNIDFKDQMTNANQKLAAEVTQNFSWTRQSTQRIDDQLSQVKITLTDHFNQIHNAENRIVELRASSLEFSQKHSNHGNKFDIIESNIQQIFETLHLTKKLTNQVQMLQNSLSTLDNYISSYQALYIQGQISESLFHCLPQAQIAKLALYESKRFDEIHKEILNDDGRGKVGQKIMEYAMFMEGITKRNSKLIREQKVQKIILNDDDDDLESDDAVQAQKSESDDGQSKQNSRKAAGQMTGAEQQLQEEMAVQVRQQVIDETQQFKTKMEISFTDVYAQIKKIDEQVSNQNTLLQEEADIRQSQAYNDSLSVKDNIAELKQYFTAIEQQSLGVCNQLKQVETVVQSVLHYLVLITHLLIQDEIDCQGIALMGVKDSNIDELPLLNRKVQAGNKVLQIKPDCLSCSSQPLSTMTAFKMACLAYNPSDITVDGKIFKRDQLLEVCTKVLWAARKEMNEVIQGKPQIQKIIRPQEKKDSTSVDSKVLTNAHIQYIQQRSLQVSPTQSIPTNINISRLQNVSRLNQVNLNIPQLIPKVAKRQQLVYRTQRRLSNLYQNLSSVVDGALIK